MSDESSTPPCDDSETLDEDPTVQIYISWSGMLEPVDVSLNTTPEELACFIDSGRDVAPPEHMQFIYKGLLLPEQEPLISSAVGNGSVLHLVLNEEPYWGRPVYVRCEDGVTRTVLCGENFYVEDIKEELSCYPGQGPPEQIRLVFAGRELKDHHTLREYNIQKPSVLLSIGQRGTGRQIETFVEYMRPERDCRDASVDTHIEVQFKSAEDNDT
eukprot:CAMPEP_0172181826 /NCGR_PEP_ID=MMETSP1050-20130122/18044_1 /TAXON_ID=233186 /ORGANISM="Cryptomonas curvata, Strain CCAP979/52" /LENGTH=213 /DNA_ID=CAMNT_0012855173 /DNA_START=232 /DNA_END=869 /DNA_ORIENTATION=-